MAIIAAKRNAGDRLYRPAASIAGKTTYLAIRSNMVCAMPTSSPNAAPTMAYPRMANPDRVDNAPTAVAVNVVATIMRSVAITLVSKL